jgi:hypothetical protein
MTNSAPTIGEHPGQFALGFREQCGMIQWIQHLSPPGDPRRRMPLGKEPVDRRAVGLLTRTHQHHITSVIRISWSNGRLHIIAQPGIRPDSHIPSDAGTATRPVTSWQ